MPFVLLFVGVLFIVLAIKGTQRQFFSLLSGDFTGSGNFIYWVVSILIIGAVGYIPKLKVFSDSFLVLVILVLFIANKGFFSQFNSQLQSGTAQSNGTTGTGASGLTTFNPLPPVPGIPTSPGYNQGVTGGTFGYPTGGYVTP